MSRLKYQSGLPGSQRTPPGAAWAPFSPGVAQGGMTPGMPLLPGALQAPLLSPSPSQLGAARARGPGVPHGFLLHSFPHRLHPSCCDLSCNGLSAPGKSVTSERRSVQRPGQTHRRGSGRAESPLAGHRLLRAGAAGGHPSATTPEPPRGGVTGGCSGAEGRKGKQTG